MLARLQISFTFGLVSLSSITAFGCAHAPQVTAPEAESTTPQAASTSAALEPSALAQARTSETRTSGPPADPMTKLDPDMNAVIVQLGALNGKPIELLSAEEARKQPTPADAVGALLKKQGKSTAPEAVEKVASRTIPGPGGALPLRIYTPKTGKAPYPVIVYYHGGGFVIATIDTYDASPRGLANGAEAVVVALEYRKAPENKFPAAHDDALATYEWTLKNAASIGGNSKKVALVGESAGGNLAASVSMAARDKKEQMPLYQVLVYPIAGSDMNTDSYKENANAKPLNKAMMAWFTEKYLSKPEDAKDPRIDLLHANLANLPATTIINAEVDPLRSDGEQLAEQLRAAHVPVQQKTYSGVTHEFFGMGAAVVKAKDAMLLATSTLKRAFSEAPVGAARAGQK